MWITKAAIVRELLSRDPSKPITYPVIADLCGLSRSTVITAIRALHRERVIIQCSGCRGRPYRYRIDRAKAREMYGID